MSIIYEAINKNDKSMQDRADKSWIREDGEGSNMNRALVEDYEAHYAEQDNRLIKSRIITALGLTIILTALYAAFK